MEEPELERDFQGTVLQLNFVLFIKSWHTHYTHSLKQTFSEKITSVDENDKTIGSLQTTKLRNLGIIISFNRPDL